MHEHETAAQAVGGYSTILQARGTRFLKSPLVLLKTHPEMITEVCCDCQFLLYFSMC